VTLSRRASCGLGPKRSNVVVRVGPLKIGDDRQPALAGVTDERTYSLKDCTDQSFYLRPPRGPWRVEVEVGPTFVPQQLDPARSSDARNLGAKVGFDVRRLD